MNPEICVYMYRGVHAFVYTIVLVFMYTIIPVFMYTCVFVLVYTTILAFMYLCTQLYLCICTRVYSYTCVQRLLNFSQEVTKPLQPDVRPKYYTTSTPKKSRVFLIEICTNFHARNCAKCTNRHLLGFVYTFEQKCQNS